MEQSKVDDDVALRSAAADQRIAVGWRLHGRLVADRAADEPSLASVTDPGPACSPHWHIARLGKIEEALEGRGPGDAKDTNGPTPADPAGWCGGRRGAAAMPGVFGGVEPKISVWHGAA